jgi:UDP-N-acetyl-D-galactosamine dehydrogenase
MKAQELGYQPEVILAGRRINNSISAYSAQRLVKMLINADLPVRGARVGVLGLTFKEDCNDLRNSKVPDILTELKQFGIDAMIHDPVASAPEAAHEYGLKLTSIDEFTQLDGLILAVSHKQYLEMGQSKILSMVREGGVIVDVKSALDPHKMERGVRYWSL